MGQRSNVYVRLNWKELDGTKLSLLVADYFQWNYSLGMVDLATKITEWVDKNIQNGYGYSKKNLQNFIKQEDFNACDILEHKLKYDARNQPTLKEKDDIHPILNGIQDVFPMADSYLNTNNYVFFKQENDDGSFYLEADMDFTTNEKSIKSAFLPCVSFGSNIEENANKLRPISPEEYLVWSLYGDGERKGQTLLDKEVLAEIWDNVKENKISMDDFVNDKKDYLNLFYHISPIPDSEHIKDVLRTTYVDIQSYHNITKPMTKEQMKDFVLGDYLEQYQEMYQGYLKDYIRDISSTCALMEITSDKDLYPISFERIQKEIGYYNDNHCEWDDVKKELTTPVKNIDDFLKVVVETYHNNENLMYEKEIEEEIER